MASGWWPKGKIRNGPGYRAKLKAYEGREVAMRRQRLTPDFPPWPSTCFYPMNKKRKVGENWFLLPVADRQRLMAEHGRTGMTFGGRVTQLITVGLGFDDWEWGVTLWARNPEFLKEIVYRMRFDEAERPLCRVRPVLRQLRDHRRRRARPLPREMNGAEMNRPETAATRPSTHRSAKQPIGYQSWHDLLFVHWRVPAEVCQRLLPGRPVGRHLARRCLDRTGGVSHVGRPAPLVAGDPVPKPLCRNQCPDLRSLRRRRAGHLVLQPRSGPAAGRAGRPLGLAVALPLVSDAGRPTGRSGRATRRAAGSTQPSRRQHHAEIEPADDLAMAGHPRAGNAR